MYTAVNGSTVIVCKLNNVRYCIRAVHFQKVTIVTTIAASSITKEGYFPFKLCTIVIRRNVIDILLQCTCTCTSDSLSSLSPKILVVFSSLAKRSGENWLSV